MLCSSMVIARSVGRDNAKSMLCHIVTRKVENKITGSLPDSRGILSMMDLDDMY